MYRLSLCLFLFSAFVTVMWSFRAMAYKPHNTPQESPEPNDMNRVRILLFVLAFSAHSAFGARPAAAEFDAVSDPEVLADIKTRMALREMYDADTDELPDDVTIQPFFDREGDAQGDDGAILIDSSFLAVKWPSNASGSMRFVLYIPDGSQDSMYTMHICGFLNPRHCRNEVEYPGKTEGRCGSSDELIRKTGFFCDFVALHEISAEQNGAVLLDGEENLERYARHMADEGLGQRYPPEIHFEFAELGDEGFDDDYMAPAPAPAPSSARRLLSVQGPAYSGTHMTMRAGPGGHRGKNGRSSFVTLPGSLGGR